MDELQLKERILTNGNLPEHVAIIMDGNGRWACGKSLPRVAGHGEGINSVREVVNAAGEIGIKYLTLYTFSTENWSRPASEVSAIMRLLLRTIRAEVNELNRNNVRLRVIGNLEELPLPARRSMQNAIKLLRNNTGLCLNLALSYSSRREILDAVRKIARKAHDGQIKIKDINEDLVCQHLHTAGMPDPDLLIRTSGEFRISNFLLWQLAYTEIYVSDVLWPDFRRKEFYSAISAYQCRERRFGKVSEQIQYESSALASEQ